MKLELKLILIASGARRSCEEGAPLSTSFLLTLFFYLPCTATTEKLSQGYSATQNARKARSRMRCQLCGVGLSERCAILAPDFTATDRSKLSNNLRSNGIVIMTSPEDGIDDSVTGQELDTVRKTSATVKETMPQQPTQPNRSEYERLFGIDDFLDEQPTTSRRELWSYYLYYNGEATSKISVDRL